MRLMHFSRWVAALTLAIAPSVFVLRVGAAMREKTSATNSDARSAAELVRQALRSEIAGDNERRAAYLDDALQVDGNFTAAHWQSSEVQQSGQWLPFSYAVDIDSVEQQGEAECYNLVVADFDSYFVGQQRLLVHDNNLRQVTTALVPGLVEDLKETLRLK